MVLPTWTMRLASHAHDLDENAHDTKGGWHQPVRVATTADITIATALNSGDTIDGVTLATGDRVLVKDQTADEQNGIYIAGATPARSEDGDASEEILGSLVYVIAGTANGGKVFRNTNTSAVVVDTDTISFDELAAGSSIAALDDIPDVNAPSPSDGDVLTWDSTPGEWVAAAPTGTGSLTVDDGVTSVSPVDTIVFAATGDANVDVTDDGGGQVTVTVDATAGGGSSADPIADNFGTPDTAFEFDTSSFTGLTALSTTPDGEDANTSVAGHYYIKDNDSEFVGRYASVTPAFTAIAKLSDATLRANYSHAGLFCGVATPGKMVSVLARFGDGQFILTFTQTGPTDTGPGTPSVTDPPATPLAYPLYLGIKCVSSTDVSYYMSHTGHVWHAILLNHNNTMTVASVGIGIFVLGGGTGQTSAAFDYLRIWNSAKTFVL